SILDNPIEAKRRIGYVPENPSMYNDMVVREYIRFIGAIKGVPKSRLSSQVDYMIERCALEDVVKKRIGELSKGYRQRVALAQALVNDPPVLVLDEPTSGLDPKQIYEIRQFIKSMAGERTIILSTHILPEVSMTCSKVVIINDGRIVASGPTEEIGENLMKSRQVEIRVSGDPERVKEAIGKVNGVRGIYETDGVYTIDIEKDVEVRPELARSIVNSGLDLLEMKSKSYSLEEVFLKLVTEEEGGAKA
ncbi:MAG: ABC transporter ATP-binding protein, partial [Spirochaetes bacterium]